MTAHPYPLYSAALDILAAPVTFFSKFNSISRQTKWLLLAIIVSAVVASQLFYGGMSEDWIVAQQMMQLKDLNPDELAATEEFTRQSADYYGYIIGGSAAVILLLQMAVLSGVYLFLSLFFIKKDRPNYKSWFATVVWGHFPWFVYYLCISALALVSSEPNIPFALFNFASINQLFLHLSESHALYAWAQLLDVFYLWSMILMVIAVRARFELSWVKASMMACSPYVTSFAVWYVVA